MQKTTLILAILLTPLLVSACGSNNSRSEVAAELELEGPVRSQYHYLALNPYGEGLMHPGFIVGIEKTERTLIGVKDRSDSYYTRFRDFPGEGDERTTVLNAHVEAITDDDNPMFVSHVLEYGLNGEEDGSAPERIRAQFLYNIHLPASDDEAEAKANATVASDKGTGYYHDGWRALTDRLGPQVFERLESADRSGRPFTHLIVGAMGWDNNQVESIRRYNALLGNMIEASENANGGVFNPLFIGVTWPSVWSVDGYFDIAKLAAKLVGYPNKADDADEIGYVYANWLINHLALSAKSAHPDLKVVVLGHSFGARITSRAVFSGELLRSETPSEHVDLLVGLQAAFSANRFIDGSHGLPTGRDDCDVCGPGVEGAPYGELNGFKGKTVMTWSEHDGANPLAYLISRAVHMGGHRGFEASKRAPDVFAQIDSDEQGGLPTCDELEHDKVLIVDGTDFILDHSDILDIEAGAFLWSAIACFAPSTTRDGAV